jgi:hypothetical protein
MALLSITAVFGHALQPRHALACGVEVASTDVQKEEDLKLLISYAIYSL